MGLRHQADKLRLWGPTPGCQVETSFVKKSTLGMGKGVGSREEVVLGREEDGPALCQPQVLPAGVAARPGFGLSPIYPGMPRLPASGPVLQLWSRPSSSPSSSPTQNG